MRWLCTGCLPKTSNSGARIKASRGRGIPERRWSVGSRRLGKDGTQAHDASDGRVGTDHRDGAVVIPQTSRPSVTGREPRGLVDSRKPVDRLTHASLNGPAAAAPPRFSEIGGSGLGTIDARQFGISLEQSRHEPFGDFRDDGGGQQAPRRGAKSRPQRPCRARRTPPRRRPADPCTYPAPAPPARLPRRCAQRAGAPRSQRCARRTRWHHAGQRPSPRPLSPQCRNSREAPASRGESGSQLPLAL